MAIGETVQLTAAVLDQNGQPISGAVVNWSSNNVNVATVSSQGLVTAVMNGTAAITARSGSVTQNATVTVRQTVASITIEPETANLTAIGETVQLTAAVLDQSGQPVDGAVVNWSSNNVNVATVSSQGLVTAVMNGTATITARVGNDSATAAVTVLVPRTDRDVLVDFYESAGGDHWTVKSNWLSVRPLETWYGVTVDSDGRVTQIDLPNNNLHGKLTSELGYLAALATLRVDRNQLTGKIPPEIGMLTNLHRLVLSSNQLTGAVPAELGRLSELEELLLSSNRLTGSIPGELGDLARLTVLSLSVNELDGPIPGELGRLKQLRTLRLDQNRLSGSIPVELTGMTELRSMVLADNRLTGEIPSNLSLLENLAELLLDHNVLEGSIPSQLGLLAELKRLGLAGNRLSGAVPFSLGNLSLLTHLHLFSNPGLSGILPSSFTSLKLEELLLEGTQLCVPRDDSYDAWLETIPVKTVNTCSNLESTVLASLFNRTSGSYWEDYTNWLTDRPTGTWYGVTTDMDGSVTGIDLSDNNLNGSIPGELAGLSKLESLNLSANGLLSGPLPRELLQLELRELQLDGTRLCAPQDAEFRAWLREIPVKSVTSCEDLDLDTLRALFALFNNTNGPNWNDRTNWNSDAPLDEWYGITVDATGRITELNLAGNNLSGSLPAELSALSNLKKLDVSGNEGLTGPLPDTWTSLTLEYLWMEGTQLCAQPSSEFQNWLDEIPEYSVMNCTDTRPEWYVLGLLYNSTNGADWTNNDNWLSEAPLGEWYGVTTDVNGDLTALELGGNNLIGEIPPGLARLSGLISLNLSSNGLSGEIPAELGQISALKRLVLSENDLSGEIPAELGQIKGLEELYLGYNDLSGEIPAELGRLTRLRWLDLDRNDLSGAIPAELGRLTRLESLVLSNNNLNGVIPSGFGQMTSLDFLSLERNGLSGEIPAELGQITGLRFLFLGQNDLTGVIPAEIGQLAGLENLQLHRNNLSGPIPYELRQLERLINLNLSHNALSGRIPAELWQLSDLYTLDFSFNDLSGSIPRELARLTRLSTLILGSNPRLSGPLSNSFTSLQLETLHLGGTALCIPTTPEFQTWIQRIRTSRVASCLAFTSAAAYLTQAAQSLTHPVPLVAGEAALLRVFITGDPELGMSIPPVQAVFYNGGRVVHTVDIPERNTEVSERIEEGMLMYSANAEIPGSVVLAGLEMVVNIDQAGSSDAGPNPVMRIPETGRQALDVRTVPPFNLTLVPFLWMESPHIAVLDDTDGLTGDDELFWQTRNLLPIADFEVEVREPVWTSTDPVIYYSYPMLQETMAIRALDGSDRYYMGILRAGGGQAELPGTSSVSILDAEVIAHEIGHNLNLFHAPCGGAFGSDPNYPYDDGSVGSWGYDFRDGTLVDPGSPDLMSYCHPQWISEYGFTRAINYLATQPQLLALAAVPSVATRIGARGLLVWGGVNEYGDLELEPSFVVDSSPSVPMRSGPYQLTGQTASGNTVFNVDFGMAELGDGPGNAFAFVLPVQPGWAESLHGITLSGPEGIVTLDRDSDRSAALLMDRSMGMVRGILREWLDTSDVSPRTRPTLPEPGLEIVVSPGVPGPDSW